MKQILLTSFTKTINGVRIFRDDIEYLLNLFTSKNLKITIKDESSIYESLDELKQIKGNDDLTFKINGRKIIDTLQSDDVTISFNDNSVSIASFDSEEMRSFGFELSAFFESKAKWHYKVFRPTIWGIVSTWPLAPVLMTLREYPNTPIQILLLVVEAFLVTLFLFSVFLRNTNYGVTLTRKHEYGFWARNKDKIILAILGALFGSLLTIFIQWLQN